MVDVYTLVEALWGYNTEENSSPYSEQSYRRRKLSSWLSEVNERNDVTHVINDGENSEVN